MLDDINYLLFFPSRICVHGVVYDNFILCCGHPCLHMSTVLSGVKHYSTEQRSNVSLCLAVLFFCMTAFMFRGLAEQTHVLLLSSPFFRKCKRRSLLCSTADLPQETTVDWRCSNYKHGCPHLMV